MPEPATPDAVREPASRDSAAHSSAESAGAGAARLAHDVRGTWSELSEMLSLRRRLAESELRSDMAAARRFGIVTAAALALAVAGLGAIASALGAYADQRLAHEFPWITIGVGAALTVGGLLVSLLAWWRLRRNLLLFESSRAELQEDLVWLEEWIGHRLPNDAA